MLSRLRGNDGEGARVWGWDLLRGLCALTVATYHLLYWLEIAELPALGTYGVYLFFVLSGASLAYNYDAQRLRGVRDIGQFLLARWMRLAPLYLLLCPVYLAMLANYSGHWVDDIPQRLALNATFAFGLWDPAVTALLIGGWSLGIEFVYYLVFPWIVRVLPHAALRALLFVLFAAMQWMWIEATVGTKGWVDAVVSYHQAPAFFAYFFGGCVIGHVRRSVDLRWPLGAGVAVWAAMGVLLACLMPQHAGEELLGLRGAVLSLACFGVVFASGQVVVPSGRARALAGWLGDVTYGCYLLHPMVLWAVLWFVWPGAVGEPMPLRVGLLVVVLASTCVLAATSERWSERPLRRLARPRRN